MYGFSEENTTVTTYAARMSAGIHENCKLVSLTRNKLEFKNGGGAEVLEVVFENEAGETFTHNEFPLDRKQVETQAKQWKQLSKPEDIKNYVKEQFTLQGQYLFHMLSPFVTQQALIDGAGAGKVSGWEDFLDAIIETVGKSYEGVKVRIKLVLNKKDYTTFPKGVRGGGFIGRMDEPNKLSINPKYDRVVLSTPTAESAMDAESLPFDDTTEEPVLADDFGDDDLFN